MPELTQEQKENIEWQSWVYNSHRWVEYEKGYYQCSFCGHNATNQMGVTSGVGLCKQNPEIIKHNNR